MKLKTFGRITFLSIFVAGWFFSTINPLSAESEPPSTDSASSPTDTGKSSEESTTAPAAPEPPKVLVDPETQLRKVSEADQSAAANSPEPSKMAEQTTTVTLEQNMAEFLDFGKNIAQVFVANPEIVDVQLNGARSAYVFARKPGTTTVFVSDREGRTLVRVNLRVTHNLKQLRQSIQTSFPNETVSLESTPAGILISGTASNASVSKDIEALVAGFLLKDDKLTNALTVAAPTQILLKVKIAEVQRETLSQFGINWATVGQLDNFTYGILTGRSPVASAIDPTDPSAFPFVRSKDPTDGTARLNSYGFRFKDSKVDLNSLIDALDSETLATVLAEPNLMAVSGETASFLVGGEFPYPVPQQQNITIDFKEYGIRLSFTPTVRSGNKINLRVRPEVSELDRQNSVNIPIIGAGAVKVPGLKTRRAETSVELGNGQSLAIAGLISMGMRNNYNDIPGLADLPILGALFRSTSFLSGKSELVIIVTPILVEPTSDPKALSLPTDNLKMASNLEMLLFRRLNRGSDRSVKDFNNVHLAGHAGFNSEEDN